jgi:hypothetical protein
LRRGRPLGTEELWVAAIGAVLFAACTDNLDAGFNRPRGPLPVDQANPVILYQDDWSGDWLGEYAVLLANSGGPPLAGIVINASKIWGDLDINVSGWNDLVNAARSSGLKNIPGVTPSAGAPLVVPADGQIDSTVSNNSAGAQLIRDLSTQLSQPGLPVVVVSATSLTDLADAYLIDHSVVDRVVVVAALGGYSAPNASMNAPNGDMDPWADWIVAQRFRYIQVSAYYDQTGDVTTADLASLPQNALGDRIATKQPNIIPVLQACDQVALLAMGLPGFTVSAQQMSPDTSGGFDPTQGPPLVPDPNGNDWVVTQITAPLAQSRLWQMLLDPQIFGP